MKTTLLCISVIFFALFIVLSSCKKDDEEKPDPQPQPDQYTLLVTQNVGPEGGIITTNDVIIRIPDGAFGSTHSIQLYSSSVVNSFGQQGSSAVFWVKGLPENFSKPLNVSMKYQGTPENGNYIAMGKYGIATSVMDTVIHHDFFPATDSAGFFNALIQPPAGKTGSNKGIAKYEGKFGVPLLCVRAYMYYQTDHFIVYFPSQHMSGGAIQKLADGLEAAYDTLLSWNFSYSARTSWPLQVTVKDMDPEIFGISLRSFPWTANSGCIEVNSTLVNDHEMIKITGAHEFFHVVQDLYNYDELYNWIQESSSTWFEKFFSSDPSNYAPSVRDGLHLQPFLGLQAGTSESVTQHGYGCAAVLEYIEEKYGKQMIRNIWLDCQQGKHPVKAIENASDLFVFWWTDFMKKYFLGQVYSDMNVAIFSGNDTYNITGPETNGFSYTRAYPDLSGYIYIVNPKYAGISEDASLKLTLTGNGRHMVAFKKTGSNIEIIGQSANEIIVQDLKGLQQTSSRIYVLVTNYLNTPPDYTAMSDITLTGQVVNTPAYKFKSARINYQFRGENVYTCPDTTFYLDFSPGISTYVIEGIFNGNTFVGTYEGSDREETIIITLDTVQKKVTSLNLESTLFLGEYQAVHTLIAHDIPSYSGYDHKFMIVGPTACDKVTEINYTSTYNCTPSLSNWYCDSYSYIDVVFFENKKE